MPSLLVVDGYNVLQAWSNTQAYGHKDLDRARFQLLTVLCSCTSYWGYELVVVFDAANVKGGLERHETLGSTVRVLFSAEGVSADTVIERIVAEAGSYEQVIVATSDAAEQSFAFGKGALRWPARELLRRVQTAQCEISTLSSRCEYHSLRDQLTPEVLAEFNRLRLEPLPPRPRERQKMKGVCPGRRGSVNRPL